MSGEELVFDMEGNGLLDTVTKIHCICILSLDTLKVDNYGPNEEDIYKALLRLYRANRIIGHNICGFDVPAIRIFYPKWTYRSARDTLVCSRLLHPDRPRHSIAYYGSRYGREKPEHEDWTTYSDAMLFRCSEDTLINAELWEEQVGEGIDNGEWDESIELEQKVIYNHQKQIKAGVDVNLFKVNETILRLDTEIEEIEEEIKERMQPRVIKVGDPYAKVFTKGGDVTANVKKYFEGKEVIKWKKCTL